MKSATVKAVFQLETVGDLLEAYRRLIDEEYVISDRLCPGNEKSGVTIWVIRETNRVRD